MAEYNEKWEEKAANLITERNVRVLDYGMNPNSKTVNNIEERASRFLSRAKGKVR